MTEPTKGMAEETGNPSLAEALDTKHELPDVGTLPKGTDFQPVTTGSTPVDTYPPGTMPAEHSSIPTDGKNVPIAYVGEVPDDDTNDASR
jgi:hypothetical protein